MIESRFDRKPFEDRYLCSLGSAILGTIGAVGVLGETGVAIAGPLLTAGIGAGVSAAAGGNPLTGALIGGGAGALGAATGLGSDALAFGSSIDPFTSAGDANSTIGSMLATPETSTAGMDPVMAANVQAEDQAAAGKAMFGDSFSAAPDAVSNAGPEAAAAGKVAQGAGGLNKTALALGALMMGGQMLNKPQQYPASSVASTLAGAQAQAQGPLWNTPLQTNYFQPRQLQNLPANPYTAAMAPGQSYLTNNNVQYPAWPTPQAHGGSIGALNAHAAGGAEHEFSTRNGQHYVPGDDGGTDDTVPAQLSSGEYVLTAHDISVLGGGNNEAGARKVDKWREELHRSVGGGKFIPAKAQGALSRLSPGGAR